MKRIQKRLWAACMGAVVGLTGIANASVTISPSSIQVKPGAQVQFNATGSADGVVIWGVSGAGCVGIGCGAITADGLYTAPATAPSPSAVTVTATSLADLSEVGTAAVTIGSATTVGVSISPASVTLAVKGQQQFTATVSGSSNTAVTWTVSGTGCVSGSCGTVTSSGLYTAPATVPVPAVATVKATSAADPSKSASASVVIEAATAVTVSVSPASAQVPAGGQQQFTAGVTGATNTAVKWSLSGAGCSGATCGSISVSGLYTAPGSVPSPATVKVIATSVADPSASGSATITITAASGLTLSPSSPTVKPQAQIQFSASGPGSGIVVWSATGSGCTGITCGSITSTGLYTAPASAPNPNTVRITATSLVNPAVTGSTTVTISSTNVSVSVSPGSVSVDVGARQQFTSTVTGTSNTAVTWSISGYDCAGTTCGTISTTGLYTAPSVLPVPPFATITATSQADPSKSGSASVQVVQKVGVTISPASAQVVEGQTKQFTAAVTGTTDTAVTWTVSGTGCSGSGCGSISSSGLYTAPESIPSKVVITATSVADDSESATAAVTILAPVVVTLSPTSAIVAVGAQQTFQVNVAGTTNKAVSWSVSGSGCSGSACGTISSAGVYTAPPGLPSTATVIVKATSQALATASASATVSLVATNNSKLAGQYAFSFTGYDGNGSYLAAGSLTADGKGNFTAGQEDVDDIAGPAHVTITGTYQINSDNRGTMTMHSSLGTYTYKIAMNALGKKGRFVSFDQSGVRGSGVLELEDSTAFDPAVFANGYVMALSGQDSYGGRAAALGLIFPDGADFISGSTLDVNDAGSVPSTFAAFSGIYSVDATGRGTATLIVPGLGSGVLDFAFYVVSANELLMVSTDPITLNNLILSGPALMQNGAPFTTGSFAGGSIFSLTGTNGSTPDDKVGRFNFNGGGTVSVNFDENNGGNITVAGSMTGAYDLELNGRGTLNLDTTTGGALVWYVYATGPNQGFVMDASTSAAGIGQVYAEGIVPPYSNSDILGSYFMGPDDPIIQGTPISSGVSSFDGGSSVGGQGSITGAEDTSKSSSLSTNQVIAGTYSVSAVSNNGRGAILLTSPSSATIAVWVAGTSEVVGLDLNSTVTQPVILHFEQ